MPPPRYFLCMRQQNQTVRRGPYRTIEDAKRALVRIQKRKDNGHSHPNHPFTS